MAFKVGLDFAPGTTDACKKLVSKFPPAAILSAYRSARSEYGTSDIVLVILGDEIRGGTRSAYVKGLSLTLGPRVTEFGVAHKSAHAVVSLPVEQEAMWLVIVGGPGPIPPMCVIFAVSYEVANTGENLTLS